MHEIDERIDYENFYSSYIKKYKISNGELIGLCPFHNDTKASFSANLTTGQFNCFACGEKGNAVDFLAKIKNIDTKEAYKILLKEAGLYEEPKKAEKKEKYTLEQYCADKHLPIEFIQSLQVKNTKTGIAIPYMDESGQIIAVRYRYGKRMFSWKKGSKVNLYGLWFMQRIRELGYVVLVEGESDSHTLWFHRIPALGVPGASTFQAQWVDILKGLKIYIHKEPDIGGETFVRKISEALATENFEEEVFEISIPDFKDPSDLHIVAGEEFEGRWQAVMNMAKKIDIKKMAVKVDETFPGAPVQLRQPPGWRFSEKGIEMLDKKTGLYSNVCRTPLLLSKRLKSLDTGEEKVEIAFKRDNSWQTAIVQRSTIFQSRTLPQLADIGITVSSENAKYLVKYLTDLEAENFDLLEVYKCVSQLGWYGKNFLPGMAGNLVIDVDRTSQKWVDAYCQEGTFEEWKEKITPYRENYIFRFILASSFAAPLLKLLNHRIFIVHNWADSRSGKTAALKAALSVWGDPEELMATFNATKVGLERIAAFFNDLPLGIDEKQVAGNRQDFIESLVYMLSSGTSKVRGAKGGGLQASKTWRSVIITTGEEPLTTSYSQGGVYTRAIQIYGSPFDSEEGARDMHYISENIYGHAGPVFIEKLIGELKKDSMFLKDMFQEEKSRLEEEYSEKLGSHISSVAVVTLADKLISQWIFEDDNRSREMGEYILDSLEDEKEADATERAYNFLREWLIANSSQFTSDVKGERYGYMDGDKFYVFPYILDKALTTQGYSYRKTIKALGERGLIGVTYLKNKKEYCVRKKFDGKTSRFIEFHFEDLEETPPF